MFPLPIHTVQLVLQYISDSDSLPAHLLSAPLRQRHHFISPSSPIEYFCWPHPDSATAIDLLHRLPPLSDHPSFPTRYTSDAESTFAHVQISPQGLRMLFHWDGGWKYHDLRLMPFPSPSFSTPPPLTAEPDDAYWDAYGAVEHDTLIEEENAYWSQYASVQGSADSTIPSPLPTQRTNYKDDGSASSPQADPIMDIPVDAIHSRPTPGPPSPIDLAHLLSKIFPRKEVYSPALDDPVSTEPLAESSTPPLPNGYPDTSSITVKLNGVPLSDCPSRLQAEDKALMDSIKGLYSLWRAGRKAEPDDKQRATFLQIVQAAVAHE